MAIGVGLLAAGTLLNAYGQYAEGRARAAQLKDEAGALRENAQLTRQGGQYKAQAQQLEANQVLGSQIASIGASGIESDSTNVLDLVRQAHTNAEFDRLNIIYGSELEARSMEARAHAAEKASKQAKQLGFFNAITKIGLGAGDIASAKKG